MTRTLGLAAIVMVVLICVVAVIDSVIRLRARRAERSEEQFRPGLEQSIARYLAGSAESPSATATGERDVLLRAALEALGDLRGSERMRLADLLDRLGYVAEAAAALTARRRDVRRRAAETLAVIGTDGTLPALTAGLGDQDPAVRCACARPLAESGGKDVIEAVIATVSRDVRAVPGQSAAVVLALARRWPDALAPLLSRDAVPAARAMAVEVVGVLRLAQHQSLLRACLADGDDLAASAARGLGSIGATGAVGELIGLARDSQRAARTRQAAIVALGSIGDLDALPVLESLLGSDDWSVAAAAARSLYELGAAGVAVLHRASTCPQAGRREQAEAVLQQ